MKDYGLIGKDIRYSSSKQLFKNIFDSDLYDIIDTDNISKELLLEYKGLNVTTPYKIEIIKYLDELDPLVEDIGSVNCIKNDNGTLIGYNTDYLGFSKSLEDKDIKSMLVLGNGGVVRMIRRYCRDHDIDLTICGRSGEYDVDYEHVDYDYDCIVNATKFGVVPPIDYDKIKEDTLAFDLCYGSDTAFIIECRKHDHLKNMNGAFMLFEQAYESYRIWNLKY